MWFFIILGVLVSLDVALFIVYKVIKKKKDKEAETIDAEVNDNERK